ncbi:hypothetical protein BpHYR1_010207 [Brachionus plicatilis]|uniref:Uncharacterized protein n=1 Tax=Brachionus plicatilis TaxID=10195 RepID=A0A3M7PCK2_BRAPC|nr:hypothetical protein BpHYR1_010207 [Brachionus plicatilis]
MKIPDRTETQKKVARVKYDESYFTLSHVTLLQHQQVQNIPQLRNLSRNYLVGWSFLRGVFRRQSYAKVDLQSTKLSF